jgi:heat-inducible transcriptional repressor
MLTERQQRILVYIVELHVATAEPVGSRHLKKHFNLPFSAATIRNDMSDLEGLGLLCQPHASAGRVPTDEGYRCYVASLGKLDSGETDILGEDRGCLQSLEKEYLNKCDEVRSVLSNSVKILSEISRLTGIAVSSGGDENSVKKVQLVGVSHSRVLLVLISTSGVVTNYNLPTALELPQTLLNRLSDLINSNCSQSSINELISDEIGVLREIEQNYRKAVGSLFTGISDRIVEAVTEDRLYLDGMSLILDQPEFNNVESARFVLDRLGKEAGLSKLLHVADCDEPKVIINLGDKIDGLKDFSLISSRYEGAKGHGSIGILGPRRMNYARVMALVGWVSRRISTILSDE